MTTERMKLADRIEAALDVEVATTDRQLRNLLRESAAALRAPEADAGAVAWHERLFDRLAQLEAGGAKGMTINQIVGLIGFVRDGEAPTAAGIAAPPETEAEMVAREIANADAQDADISASEVVFFAELKRRGAPPAASADAVRADKIDAAMKWPAGCHSANSCDRHQQCMYANCRYEGKDIKPDIATAKAALTVPVADADAGMQERAAKVADARCVETRAKAQACKAPSQQSWFARSIEARTIAEHIRALPLFPDATRS